MAAIAGVITGHIALSQIKQHREGGKGMAIAGSAVGYEVIGFIRIYVVVLASSSHGRRAAEAAWATERVASR